MPVIAGWGNFPRKNGAVESPPDASALRKYLHAPGTVVPRGAGRSYGDAALGADLTLDMRRFDRFVSLDAEAGILTVEAGVMLSDIIDTLLPRGFFPAVVPGTRHVTAGGMVASNVHGKNHHASGGFGAQITNLKLVTAAGELVACNARENADLFRATIGGMGLTGIVIEVSFRVIPVETGFIRQEVHIAPDLDTAMRLLEGTSGWPYTVAWIDGLATGGSLGRSLVYLGEHAKVEELTESRRKRPYDAGGAPNLSIPVFLPAFALNRHSMRLLNGLYYRRGRAKEGTSIVGYRPYFFPLDAVSHWNRAYGRQGFFQHQSVFPRQVSRDALGEMLGLISRRGNPSFLTVLKLLGPDDSGLMSFPMEGYTLAVDFPVSAATLHLADELDQIVRTYGGRLYLAKDSRQSRATMEAGYPHLAAFRAFRLQSGAATRFRSDMSERLGL